MDVIRHYVNVEPLQEGNVSFAYVTEYNYRTKEFDPIVVITGEYAHRTNVTLRVRKGLPPYGKGANPSPEGALKEDYVYTFTRKDRDPYVSFADGGRYLPPGGKRLLKLESVNVGKINTNIMRVEPRNIVQLLAREEGSYSRYEWKRDVDDEETAELAGAGEERKFTCPNRLNEKEFTFLPLKMNDGKATNGVFLVSVLNADKNAATIEGSFLLHFHKKPPNREIGCPREEGTAKQKGTTRKNRHHALCFATDYLLRPCNLFLNLSTLPPASTNFCLPVKKGWHLEQISTLISPPLVDLVVTVSPHAHLMTHSSY
jgi:hypothetical protein